MHTTFLVILLLSPVVVAAQELSLGLAEIPEAELKGSGEGENGPAFELGLEELADLVETDTPVEKDRATTRLQIDLRTSGPPTIELPSFIVDRHAEMRMKWDHPMARLEHHMDRELNRVLTGDPNSTPGIPLVSVNVMEIVRLIKEWRQKRAEKRADELEIEAAADLELKVVEADGSAPVEISILPMVEGYVADAVHITCSPPGRCRWPAAPVRPMTILVRGSGAAVARVPMGAAGLAITLARVGKLELGCATGQAVPCLVHVREYPSLITIPVPVQVNAQRGELISVPATGMTLLVPEGSYSVEQGGANPARLEVKSNRKVDDSD